MNFIILGDKFAKRMKSKGCSGLWPITTNKNIIQNQQSVIKSCFPKAHIIYVYGFEPKRIRNFIESHAPFQEIHFIENSRYDKQNSAYSLSLAQRFLQQDTFILFGDKILKKNIFNNFHKAQGSQIFLSKKTHNTLGCIINNNKIENISYDLENHLYELYYLNRTHSHSLAKILQDTRYHNYFIFELINMLIETTQTFQPLFI